MFLLGAICLLVRQQIMEARRLWQHTALEGALGQLSRRDSSSDQRHYHPENYCKLQYVTKFRQDYPLPSARAVNIG